LKVDGFVIRRRTQGKPFKLLQPLLFRSKDMLMNDTVEEFFHAISVRDEKALRYKRSFI